MIDLVFLPGVRLTELEVERRRARTHLAWLLRLVTRGMGKETTKVRKSGGKGRAELWMPLWKEGREDSKAKTVHLVEIAIPGLECRLIGKNLLFHITG